MQNDARRRCSGDSGFKRGLSTDALTSRSQSSHGNTTDSVRVNVIVARDLKGPHERCSSAAREVRVDPIETRE